MYIKNRNLYRILPKFWQLWEVKEKVNKKKLLKILLLISLFISLGFNYSLWNKLEMSENRVNALLSSGIFDEEKE